MRLFLLRFIIREQMNIFDKHDIETDLNRIEDVFATGIFTPNKFSENPFLSAAITEVLICLNDLLQKSKDVGLPVTFTDDVRTIGGVKDITVLVNKVRNVRCHIGSKSQIINGTDKIGMAIIPGEKSMKIGDVEMKSDYDNDLLFVFGEFSIYLHRHIVRAYQEVKANLIQFID